MDGRAELWADIERLQRSSRDLAAELQVTAAQRDTAEVARAAAEDARVTAVARADALEVTKAATEAKLAEVSEALGALQARHRESVASRERVERALSEALGAIPPPRPALTALLEDRGLVGTDEASFALRAIGDARLGTSLLGLLEVQDPAATRAWLDERMALLCGRPDCPAPPGRAVVTVPPERCDVCGGSDIRRAVRRFIDACLITGLLRVVIVGGSPRYHRQLSELVTDQRVRLRLIPGDRRRSAKQAKADQEGADVVIVWGGTMLDHSVSELYGTGPARVVRVPHRGIARMLEQAADAMDQ